MCYQRQRYANDLLVEQSKTCSGRGAAKVVKSWKIIREKGFGIWKKRWRRVSSIWFNAYKQLKAKDVIDIQWFYDSLIFLERIPDRPTSKAVKMWRKGEVIAQERKEENTELPVATTRKSGDFELQDGLLCRFDFYLNITGSYIMKC